MPLLIRLPERDFPQALPLAEDLLEHLSSRWPGTFILVVGPEALPDWSRLSQVDWVKLPSAPRFQPELADDWLRVVLKRYGIQAGIAIGKPGTIGCPMFDLLDVRGAAASPAEPVWRSFLDAWLAARLPIELSLDGASSRESLVAVLDGHAAVDAPCGLAVRWSGPVGPGLGHLLSAAMERTGLAGSRVTLELMASELFATRQRGLTHQLSDFLTEPSFGPQFMRLIGTLLGLPAGVEIRVRTVSRRPWIHRSTALFNGSLSALRSVLGAVGRGGTA